MPLLLPKESEAPLPDLLAIIRGGFRDSCLHQLLGVGLRATPGGCVKAACLKESHASPQKMTLTFFHYQI